MSDETRSLVCPRCGMFQTGLLAHETADDCIRVLGETVRKQREDFEALWTVSEDLVRMLRAKGLIE